MSQYPFHTENGFSVPAITAEQMREVDRLAVEMFHLGILQMMENAGRSLAQNVMAMLGNDRDGIVVLAGSGGNGGGGLCCARHLYNHGITVHVILSKEQSSIKGAARTQLDILQKMGLHPIDPNNASTTILEAPIIVDALIGYSLQDQPHGLTAELIDLSNHHAARVISLDVPSGVNATTGETPGATIQPERTLTLALPKTGLRHVDGELYLADIGIPPQVYHHLQLEFEPFFGDRYWLRLVPE